MESTILNIHDLVLVISILSALYLAIMLFLEKNKTSGLYLPIFLVLVAMEALFILSAYSKIGETYISLASPILYFLLITTFYIKGQTFYMYISYSLNGEYLINKRALLHLTPLFIYASTLFISFDATTDLYNNFHIWQANFFNPLSYHITLIAYGLAALWRIKKNHSALRQEEKNIRYLPIIVWAYFSIWLITFSAHTIFHLAQATIIASLFGKLSIYLNFIVLLALFTILWQQRPYIKMPYDKKDKPYPPANIDIHVRKIGQFMAKKKPYLNPNMTLERMAEDLELTPRALSTILNELYGINFYQYLNQHRIEEAKHLLNSQSKDTHISSIYHRAGFSSRTTFNVKFKETVGKTPSEYRLNV